MWHYLLTPLEDVLIGLIWFAPFFNRTIVWMEKKFKLNYGSKLRPYEENQVHEGIELDPLPALCYTSARAILSATGILIKENAPNRMRGAFLLSIINQPQTRFQFSHHPRRATAG